MEGNSTKINSDQRIKSDGMVTGFATSYRDDLGSQLSQSYDKKRIKLNGNRFAVQNDSDNDSDSGSDSEKNRIGKGTKNEKDNGLL